MQERIHSSSTVATANFQTFKPVPPISTRFQTSGPFRQLILPRTHHNSPTTTSIPLCHLQQYRHNIRLNILLSNLWFHPQRKTTKPQFHNYLYMYHSSTTSLSLCILRQILTRPLYSVPPLTTTSQSTIIPLPTISQQLNSHRLYQIRVFHKILQVINRTITSTNSFHRSSLRLSNHRVLRLPLYKNLAISYHMRSPATQSLHGSQHNVLTNRILISHHFRGNSFATFRNILFYKGFHYQSLP